MDECSDEQLSDRRRFPRHSCTGTAEIIQNGTRWAWGKYRDISRSGCFLEIYRPLPIGTEVQLRLTIEGSVLETGVKVSWAIPKVGMGLIFWDNSSG